MKPGDRASAIYGFTLIELLVVISIISMLASVTIASVSAARAKAIIGAGITFDRHTYAGLYDDASVVWDFDELSGSVVQDQSGNNNHLTVSAAPASTLNSDTPSSGKSLYIPSSSSIVKTATYLNNPPSGSFSLSLWFKVATNDGDRNILSNVRRFPRNAAGTTINTGAWSVSIHDGGNLYLDYRNSLTTVNIPSTGVAKVSVDKWYHFAATCDIVGGNSYVTIYLNSSPLVSKHAVNACAFYNSDAIYLLSPPPPDANYPPILVDNVRIYRKALPLAAIENIYLAEKEKFEKLARVDFVH